MTATQANQPPRTTMAEQLDRRLPRPGRALWDNFVDPRESLWDDGGRLDRAGRPSGRRLGRSRLPC